MTKEEIMAMVPGPELDALVGNDVMGWGRGAWRPFVDIASNYKGSHQFQPSTRITDAWEVVSKLKDEYAIATTEYRANCLCIIASPDDALKSVSVEAATAPEAICKAALIAMLDQKEATTNAL